MELVVHTVVEYEQFLYWYNLPAEIRDWVIVCTCGGGTATLALSCVDKWFADRVLALRITSMAPTTYQTANLLKYPRLQKLDLTHSSNINPMVFRKLTNLINLTLCHHDSTPSTIAHITVKMSALTKLDTSVNCAIGTLCWDSLTNLRKLIMQRDIDRVDMSMMTLLTHLNVCGHHVGGVHNVLCTLPTSITHLDVSYTNIVPRDVIVALPHLVSLRARGSSDEALSCLHMLTQLTRLNVRGNSDVYDRHLHGLTNLTYLDIRSALQVHGVPHHTTLRVLKLSNQQFGAHVNFLPLEYIVFTNFPIMVTLCPRVKSVACPALWVNICGTTALTLDVSSGTYSSVGQISPRLTSLRSVRLIKRDKTRDHNISNCIRALSDLPALTNFSCAWDRTIVLTRNGESLPAAAKYKYRK